MGCRQTGFVLLSTIPIVPLFPSFNIHSSTLMYVVQSTTVVVTIIYNVLNWVWSWGKSPMSLHPSVFQCSWTIFDWPSSCQMNVHCTEGRFQSEVNGVKALKFVKPMIAGLQHKPFSSPKYILIIIYSQANLIWAPYIYFLAPLLGDQDWNGWTHLHFQPFHLTRAKKPFPIYTVFIIQSTAVQLIVTVSGTAWSWSS